MLHPDLVKYVKWGVEAGIKPVISTNGVLLTEEKLVQLYNAGLRHLVITLHTDQSFQAFLMCCKYFSSHNIKVVNFKDRHNNVDNEDVMYFQGKLLNTAETDKLVAVYNGVVEEYESLLVETPVHTWAGNVPGTRRDFSEEVVSHRQKQCYFIGQKVINVRWDGSVVGCCFDIENDNEIGNVHDYPHIKLDLCKYNLCKHCDSNWANQ